MERSMGIVAIVLAVVLMVGWGSIFTVTERDKAIVLKFGKVVRTGLQPGLHFKIPLIENVRKFDSRVITLEADPEPFLTAEKKNVIVDAFVQWRIADLSDYFRATGGDAKLANLRFSQVIKQELRAQFARRTIQEVVSGERKQIMDILTSGTSQQAKEFGIEVVDVRIKRIELPDEVSESVYRRMVAERSRVAKELRSKGAKEAEIIKAEADKKRTVILANANGEAERIRGEGEAKAAETYAKAYQVDADFYAFYRSLNAYKESFRNSNNLMVLKPDSEFFRFFQDAKGR